MPFKDPAKRVPYINQYNRDWRKARPGYGSWYNMKSRCDNPKATGYDNYGGRGITYCDRWKVFANFQEDMGPRPPGGMSIERLDNDGNYEPGNCVWADNITQRRNQRPKRAA